MQTTTKQNDRKAIAALAKNKLAERYFKDYLVRTHHGVYQHFPHTRYICDKLQPIAEGKQKYILVALPPRHSKSMTISESFPSYYLGKNPDKRVITSAYSDTLARKFGRLNRNKLIEFGPSIFNTAISNVNSSVSNWGIEGTRGGMLSTGIGGSITGEGADLLLIDDPIKNAEEAASITIRDKIWAEWESTLSTRLQKNASVIVVMTRWHEDDLFGRLLENSPRPWELIVIPAVAEEDDLLGRIEGEPLAPDLGYDEEWAALKKLEVGTHVWESLYQQRPSPASGNIFNKNWWNYYSRKDLPDRFDEIVQSWDCTFKDKDTSDFVVGQTWGRKGTSAFLLDEVRERLSFTNTLKAIENAKRKWPRTRSILIEDKANGSAVIDTLKNRIPGIIPVEPEGGKIVRAQATSPLVEAGNVYLPAGTELTEDFIKEHSSFPNGKYDDRVDAQTQALNRLFNHGTKGRIITSNAWY